MTEVVRRFTRTVPHWRPRVAPVDLEQASRAQLDALRVTPSNTRVSDYVLVLAHDPETLDVRSPLFNAVMYDEGGLGRSGRELGALGASMVNRCIYCAAVHASRHAQIEKSNEITDALFTGGEDAGLPPKERAILDFAIRLSRTPSEAAPEDMAALRAAELDDAEILDLVLSTALFGWANRLMHVLGDPVRRGEAG